MLYNMLYSDFCEVINMIRKFFKYMVDVGDEDFLCFNNFPDMKKALVDYFVKLTKNPPRFFNQGLYGIRLYKRNSVSAIKDGNPEYFTCEVPFVRFISFTSGQMRELSWRYY